MQPKLVCNSHYVHSPSWFLDSKSKRISDLAVVEKMFVVVVSVRNERIFFSHIAFFKTLGSCSNQAELIVRVPRGM